MHFEKFAFGCLRIDGKTYQEDVVIDRDKISNRKKKPSKQFRDEFGHTPPSIEEKIPGNAIGSSLAQELTGVCR